MNTLDSARRIVRDAKRIVAFSGAGLSAESGVPTFRDVQAESGALWSKYDPATLASPEGFDADPKLVIEWYNWRRRTIAEAQPNPAHRTLAHLVNVTQNVDDLLHRAGAREVIQLHGSIARDRCHASCGFEERIELSSPPPLRRCPICGECLRPAVVWFGEMLPPDAWRRAEETCRSCDVLLVVGTSALVFPAAGLIDLTKAAGAKIIIVNTQPSGASHLADVEFLGKAGEIVPQLLDSREPRPNGEHSPAKLSVL